MRKDTETARQEAEYKMPYHHLVSFEPFHNAAVMIDGIEYFGYMGEVLRTVHGIEYQSLLDVGCGDGKMILELVRQNPEKIHAGADLSTRSILFARAFSHGTNATFYDQDVRTIPGTYDIVTCIETLEHVHDDDLTEFVTGLSEKLDADGRLIISVPTTNFPTHKKHYRHYDRALLAEHLSPHFDVESVSYSVKAGLPYYLSMRVTAKLSMFKLVRRLSAWIGKRYLFPAYAQNGRHLLAVCTKR